MFLVCGESLEHVSFAVPVGAEFSSLDELCAHLRFQSALSTFRADWPSYG